MSRDRASEVHGSSMTPVGMKRLLTLPTRAQLKRDFWRPDDPRLVVRKAWGWGFTINLARLFRRADAS